MWCWQFVLGFRRLFLFAGRQFCLVFCLFLLGSLGGVVAQNVGIGTTTPNSSALLELYDTARGLLIPRLTTGQRDAIGNPAHALMIFNIETFCLEVYDATVQRWYALSCPRNCLVAPCMPAIYGSGQACAGDTMVYRVVGCAPGYAYRWEVPPGWTIVEGQGTSTILVVPDTTDGVLAVAPCNLCGCADTAYFAVVADTCFSFCTAIGGSGDDQSYSLAQTFDGGYVLAGYTRSFGQGDYDVYVVKLDSAGGIQWTRTIGGGNADYGRGIIQASDSGYVVVGYTWSFGMGSADVYVVKLDSAGNIQWTRTIGGSSTDYGWSVVQTSDGGYAVAGTTWSYGFSGTAEVYVVKLSATGGVLWTRTVGASGGNEYGTAIVQTSDGGLAVAGHTRSYGQGGYDVYVVKLTASGGVQWARAIGGANDEFGYGLVQTYEGGYAIVGHTYSFGQGNTDVYVVKLDVNGNLQWTRTIGGPNYDYGVAIWQSPDGGYVIGGYTQSFGQGLYDVYLIKLDSAGNLQWTRTIGGSDSDYGYALVPSVDGGYVLAGHTRSFGQGLHDVYVVKLTAGGNLPFCPGGCQIGGGGQTSAGGVLGGGAWTWYGGGTSSGGLAGSGGTLFQICP